MIKLLDILLENKILVPRRDKEERAKNRIKLINQQIQQYIKGGSKGDLDLGDTSITSLPDNLIKVGGYLSLYGSKITTLNNLKHVELNLTLSHSQITSLPNNLYVGGHLNMADTPITSLPKGLEIAAGFYASDTQISALPKDIIVGSDIDLNGTKITHLPNHFNVWGNLDLDDTPLKSLPDDISIPSGYISIVNTPLSLRLDSTGTRINRNQAEKELREKYPGIEGTIYLS